MINLDKTNFNIPAKTKSIAITAMLLILSAAILPLIPTAKATEQVYIIGTPKNYNNFSNPGWTNPDNIYEDYGQYTSVTTLNQELYLTNGFSFSEELPCDSAEITKMELIIGNAFITGNIGSNAFFIGGLRSSNNNYYTYATGSHGFLTAEDQTFVIEISGAWIPYFSKEYLESDDFFLWITNTKGVASIDPESWNVDYIQIKLYYTIPEYPVADAGGPYTGDEGSPISLDGTGSSDPDEEITSYLWDLDNDGDYDDATGATPSYTWSDNGVYTIGLMVTDNEGYWSIDTSTVTINNVAPTVSEITVDSSMVSIGVEITASATFTDPGVYDTHTAQWDWGDATIESGTVTQGSGSGSVEDTHTYTEVGVYTVTLTVTDNDGGSGTSTYQYVVVYDPSAGFVTGGGWIWSPLGAYAADPSLEGKATFGFVSKYKKGATTPSGNTEFIFHAGDLEFHSSSYDWLVIAGSNAKYKGVGTINGEGEYKFMLTATDGEPDLFRIKIWTDADGETVIYDNHSGKSDDSLAGTELGGGSIVIHTVKKK